MRLARNFEDATSYLDLDLRTIRRYNTDQQIVGWYKLIGSTPTILFIEAGALFLTFGNLRQRINDFCKGTW
jgi:hypothetical protein